MICTLRITESATKYILLLSSRFIFVSKLSYDLPIFFIMIKKRNISGNVLLTYIQFLQRGVMAVAARRNGGGGDKIKFDSM